MNKIASYIIGLMIAFVSVYAMGVDITPRQVRDPKQLETWLETNVGTVVTPTAAYSADNGTTLTITGGFAQVTPSGQANGYTNAVTLGNPVTVGRWVVIAVASDATNKLGIADSGNAKLSAAFTGDADDTLTLVSTASNVWKEVSRSSN